MIAKLKIMWWDYGFEIIMILCILFILLYSIYCKLTKKKGSWYNARQNFDILSKSNKVVIKKKYSSPTQNNLYNQRRLSEYNPRESKGENECRRVLELIFNVPFRKERPDFLRNPVTGNFYNLELDCYNQKMKLAVEYNGIQHYEYTPYFHKTKDSFYNQKYRDMFKRQKCKEKNIMLIEVPHTVKIKNIEEYLREKLREKGYLV